MEHALSGEADTDDGPSFVIAHTLNDILTIPFINTVDPTMD